MQLSGFLPRFIVMLLCISDGKPQKRGLEVEEALRRTPCLGTLEP